MKCLYEYLILKGFEKSKKKSLIKYLTKDIFVLIRPKDGGWKKESDLYIYLYAKPFGNLMDEVFKNNDSIAWSYLPRKLRSDSEGCLGMVLAGLNYNSETVGESKIIPSDFNLTIDQLIGVLDSLSDENTIFIDLFSGWLDRILVKFEGIWIYLFFANVVGWTAEETLLNIKNRKMLDSGMNTGNPFKEIDKNIIEYFFKVQKLID